MLTDSSKMSNGSSTNRRCLPGSDLRKLTKSDGVPLTLEVHQVESEQNDGTVNAANLPDCGKESRSRRVPPLDLLNVGFNPSMSTRRGMLVFFYS